VTDDQEQRPAVVLDPQQDGPVAVSRPGDAGWSPAGRTDETRHRQLAALGRAHDQWVLAHPRVWKPEDANPGKSGTDYNVHAVDRSAGPKIEAEFEAAAEAAMAAAVSPAALTSSGDTSDSVMVALVPPAEVSQRLMEASAATEPLEEQHLTLIYLGTTEEAGGDPQALSTAVQDFAAAHGPLSGRSNGWGVFTNPDENVLVALWDIPGIAEFRASLRAACADEMLDLRDDNHGFTPHQTMRYETDPLTVVPGPVEDASCEFAEVWIAWGDDPWVAVPLATSAPPSPGTSTPQVSAQ
jgi:2'-5' RNA ligase